MYSDFLATFSNKSIFSPEVRHALVCTFALPCLASGLGFQRSFFSLKTTSPRLGRAVLASAALMMALAPVVWFLPPHAQTVVSGLATFASLIVGAVVVACVMPYVRDASSLVYSAGWIVNAALIALFVLESRGVLDLTFSRGLFPQVTNAVITVYALSSIVLRAGEVSRQTRSLEHELVVERSMTAYAGRLSALGEMAAGVAHEISTPLLTIQTFVELLREDLAASDEGVATSELAREGGEMRAATLQATIASGIAAAEGATQHIAKIVRGLGAFGRSDLSDPLSEVTLATLVDQAAVLIRQRLELASIRLVVEKGVESVGVVKCRPAQIVQILHHLFHNSLDALSESVIADRWIRVDAGRADGHVRIAVEDAGPGIPKEIAERVMEPFFTTKEIGKGTGLGLAVSFGLAKAHGGDLAVDSSAKHTTFVLTLPSA